MCWASFKGIYLVLFTVAVIKYPNISNLGDKGVCFSSGFQVRVHHYREIKAAGP